ncbi:uncharacterized protein CEXT_694971 [Caerostris extrusa]|uniref:Secreted protein n=1 Tax=Caerostris extrusa TaxID=172846 RepID=A0AAV4MYN8_CAEEX|nr:uncharacterized protein CEXT_694971 [Caerostris extrusa]
MADNMKRFLFVAFVAPVAFAAVLVSNHQNISCEEDIHTSCDSNVLYEALGTSGYNFWNEEVLITHCSDILSDIECKQAYLTECKSSEFDQDFKVLTNGLKSLIADMCNESSELRKGYRKHGSCIANCSGDFDFCFLRSAIGSLKENDVISDNPDERMVKNLCRFQAIFRTCAARAVEMKCGEESAVYLNELLSRPLEELVTAKCVNI